MNRRTLVAGAAGATALSPSRRHLRALPWALLWGLAALLHAVVAQAGTLQGSARYRERIALPPDAVFQAELQDIARAGAPAVVLGRARLEPAGQPPFRFEIAYDDAAVQPGGRYAVRATVTHRGRLLFTTERIHPFVPGDDAQRAPLELRLVSARGSGSSGTPRPDGLGLLPASYQGELPGADGAIAWHVDLLPAGRYQLRTTYVGRPEPNRFDDIGRWSRERDSGRLVLRGGREAPVFLMSVDGGAALRKLDLHGKPIASAHNDLLTRLPQYAPIEPRLLLRGMFLTMADAPNIVLCADGRSVPVAMEGDYRALEAAYLQQRRQPGERLLVSLEGLLAARPSMEESQPPQTTLVVERFIGAWPRERCAHALADSRCAAPTGSSCASATARSPSPTKGGASRT